MSNAWLVSAPRLGLALVEAVIGAVDGNLLDHRVSP